MQVNDHIRSDNDNMFRATAVREWFGRIGAKTHDIEPGSPWENIYAGLLFSDQVDVKIRSAKNAERILICSWLKIAMLFSSYAVSPKQCSQVQRQIMATPPGSALPKPKRYR